MFRMRGCFKGLIDLDADGYIKTTDQVFTRCLESSPAATCRTGGTARRLRRRGRGAWRRSRWRNILKNTAIEQDAVTAVLKENLDRIEAQIAAACRRRGGHGVKWP